MSLGDASPSRSAEHTDAGSDSGGFYNGSGEDESNADDDEIDPDEVPSQDEESDGGGSGIDEAPPLPLEAAAPLGFVHLLDENDEDDSSGPEDGDGLDAILGDVVF